MAVGSAVAKDVERAVMTVVALVDKKGLKVLGLAEKKAARKVEMMAVSWVLLKAV